MAEKKTAAKKPKKNTVTYKNRQFTVLDRNERALKLTDGTIHFWVRADRVEAD